MQTDSDGNDGNPDSNDGNLTSNESHVLRVLTVQPDLSAAKIAAKIGVSKPTIERTLHSLKEKGSIRREGSTRGKWVIL